MIIRSVERHIKFAGIAGARAGRAISVSEVIFCASQMPLVDGNYLFERS